MRHSLRVILLCLVVVLVACEKAEVYSDLSQRDANDILVLLHQKGVDASIVKTLRQNEVSYGVSVTPEDLDRARQLLSEHNLPRKKQPGLDEIFGQEKGFIPTAQEQQARFLLALKGEIINSLEKIPEVVEADVLINMPAPVEFASEKEPEKPTASAVVKIRPTDHAMRQLTEPKLQLFVANAVEGLDPRDVTVFITYTEEPTTGIKPGQSLILPQDDQERAVQPTVKQGDGASESAISVAGVLVNPESASRLKLYLAVFLGLLAILSLGLVIMVMQASRARQEGMAEPVLLPGESPPQLGDGTEEPR